MLIKCQKCQTKLKISDEKITDEGIKVRCPTCAAVLMVKKPAVKKEPQMEASPPEEASPPKEPSEEDMLSGFDDTFDIEDQDLSGESAQEEEEPEPDAGEEEISLDLPPEEGEAEEEEEPEAEESVDEFQLDSSFDFSEDFSKESGNEEESPVSALGEEAFKESEPVPSLDTEMKLSLKDEKESFPINEPETSPVPPVVQDGAGEQTDRPRRKPAHKEVTGYGVSTRRSLPIIIPIILIVLIMGAIYVAYTTIKSTPKEDKGELTLYDYSGEFVENEKEGKIFIIAGKVKNDFKTDRSFIQVKGVLFDNQGAEVVSKTVFAGNIPTDLECRKLPIEEIDKLLNRKMGEELSNMNVAPDTSIGFKIIFANIDEDKIDQFKVVGVGSQSVYK